MSDYLTCVHNDILSHIFANLTNKELEPISRVSSSLRQRIFGIYYLINMCSRAVFRNNIKLMSDAIAKGTNCTRTIVWQTITLGNLDFVQWMWSENLLPDDVCHIAASCGHLEILIWLLGVGFTLDRDESTLNFMFSDSQVLFDLPYASHNNNGYKLSYFDILVKKGLSQMVKWLYVNGHHTTLTPYTMECAAENGDLDLVCWLYTNRCGWNENALISAAMQGYRQVFNFLYENGQQWDENLFIQASIQGCLKIFEYTHENGNGLVWNRKVCTSVITFEQLDILQWAHENRYPLEFDSGLVIRCPKIYQWLINYGYISEI
jgi:hypothetical protein